MERRHQSASSRPYVISFILYFLTLFKRHQPLSSPAYVSLLHTYDPKVRVTWQLPTADDGIFVKMQRMQCVEEVIGAKSCPKMGYQVFGCVCVCACSIYVCVSIWRGPRGRSNLAQQSRTVIISVLSRWSGRRIGKKVSPRFLSATNVVRPRRQIRVFNARGVCLAVCGGREYCGRRLGRAGMRWSSMWSRHHKTHFLMFFLRDESVLFPCNKRRKITGQKG